MEEFLGFVIVGHVDHGKSTLIGRLLYDTDSLPEGKFEEVRRTCELLGRPLEFAYVMDHLREEREKGVTIDTAQTFFRRGNRNYVIIDAPGHKEFIKNMLTGASQADAAVLIVDVNEGMREQSRRHAYLLSMLGIEQVIVVINKMDVVGYDEGLFLKVKEEVLDFLSKLFIKPSQVIPISAKEGDNVVNHSERMRWYKGPALVDALGGFKARSSLKEKPLRFPVQDVYEIDGRKVVVGRVESGTLRRGRWCVLPGKGRIHVERIVEFGEDVHEAEAGRSTGFFTDGDVRRGDVICGGEMPNVGKEVNGSVFWLAAQPLKKGERVVCRLATQEVKARVEEIRNRMDSSTLKIKEKEAERLEGMEAAEIVLSVDKPLIYDEFNRIPTMGRFVLIRHGLVEGGGIITK